LISATGGKFSDLPDGARLGTSSVRRQAQALRLRADLKIVPLRGNVETRLQKLARGEADAILLARAGMQRLGITRDSETLTGENWLPALCQGAIGLEIRGGDTALRDLVSPADDRLSHLAVSCERGFLAALDGSCRTPIAGLARVVDASLRFRGEVLTADGRNFWTASRDMVAGPADEAAMREAYAMGEDAGREIRASAGARLPRF
jgi:hydroxymethylbilane synthase